MLASDEILSSSLSRIFYNYYSLLNLLSCLLVLGNGEQFQALFRAQGSSFSSSLQTLKATAFILCNFRVSLWRNFENLSLFLLKENLIY